MSFDFLLLCSIKGEAMIWILRLWQFPYWFMRLRRKLGFCVGPCRQRTRGRRSTLLTMVPRSISRCEKTLRWRLSRTGPGLGQDWPLLVRRLPLCWCLGMLATTLRWWPGRDSLGRFAVRIEDLDPVVAPVGDVDVSVFVFAGARGTVKLALTFTGCCPKKR